MRLIGLTGGIATGKSTVDAMLMRRGATVIDADELAREALQRGEPALDRVAERFGQVERMEDGKLTLRVPKDEAPAITARLLAEGAVVQVLDRGEGLRRSVASQTDRRCWRSTLADVS